MPAESYLDTGNRSMFANGGQPPRLHPDFAGDQLLRETLSCAPFSATADRVRPVWRALAARAEGLGWRLPAPVLTDDPDLRLLAGGKSMKPLAVQNGRHVFVVPPGATSVGPISRAARPCAVDPWVEDRRLLGVLVRRIVLRHGAAARSVAMDDPALRRGWWEVEHFPSGPCRWTSGDAELSVAGAGLLEIELAGTMRYKAERAADVVAVQAVGKVA